MAVSNGSCLDLARAEAASAAATVSSSGPPLSIVTMLRALGASAARCAPAAARSPRPPRGPGAKPLRRGLGRRRSATGPSVPGRWRLRLGQHCAREVGDEHPRRRAPLHASRRHAIGQPCALPGQGKAPRVARRANSSARHRQAVLARQSGGPGDRRAAPGAAPGAPAASAAITRVLAHARRARRRRSGRPVRLMPRDPRGRKGRHVDLAVGRPARAPLRRGRCPRCAAPRALAASIRPSTTSRLAASRLAVGSSSSSAGIGMHEAARDVHPLLLAARKGRRATGPRAFAGC